MTFHGGYKEVILFNQWKTESVGGKYAREGLLVDYLILLKLLLDRGF